MGEMFRNVRKHRPDYVIVLCVGLLMLLSLIIMFAIGPQRAQVLNQAYGYDYASSYFIWRQAVYIGLAAVAFIVANFIPLKILTGWAGKLLAIGFAACLLLYVSDLLGLPLAQETLGATRWFNLGVITFQPSEILKLGILMYMAVFLGTKAQQKNLNNWLDTMMPAAVLIGLALFIIAVLQRDLGTAISMMAIVATMFFVAGINQKIGAILVSVALFAGLVFIFSTPYRVDRVMTFVQGDSAVISADNYHTEHAKIALGSGGLTGVGIGNTVESTGYLPESINDSVFAIIGEMFGFAGVVVVMGVLGVLLMRLLKTVDRLRDMRLRLMAAGVFGWFTAHTILNIGAMIGLVPLAGITLPLLSYGGTSVIFMTAALGLVFNLSKYTERGDVTEGDSNEDSSRRRGIGRTRYAGRRSTTRA